MMVVLQQQQTESATLSKKFLSRANIKTWVGWAVDTYSVLTCLPKSFCIGWFCFTLQEFLRIKVNNNISISNNLINISACVYMWTGVMMRREEKAGETESLTARPHFVCTLCLKCWITQNKKQINNRDRCQIEMRATVAQSINENYRVSTNTLSLLLPKSTPYTCSSPLLQEKFSSGKWHSWMWSEPGLVLRTARTEDTHIHKSALTVIQYLQQNTEEMDLLCSPDATHREGKQNDRFGRKRKGRHRRGWDRG